LVGEYFVDEGEVVTNDSAVGGRRHVAVFEKAEEEAKKGEHVIGLGSV
jgi:hypothetical protein